MKLLDRLLGKNRESDERFLRECYLLLLGREADPQGLSDYLRRLAQGALDHAGILSEMISSPEYAHLRGEYDYRADPDLQPCLGQMDAELTARLANNTHLDAHDYQSCWQSVFSAGRELVIGQAEYGQQHQRRFYELCNAVGVLIEGVPQPQVLEIGVSEFTAMYRRLYPELVLDCADRPVAQDYVGFTPQRIEQIVQPRAVLSVDLNHASPQQLAERAGRYDLVLFTEVLEHLLANPLELLDTLLSLLRPQGYLYLTTPNFFRRENRQKMQAWDNPQEVYPARGGNWDLHHHYREYAHRELFRFIGEAGGVVRAFYFSPCWDEPEHPPPKEAERGNLVFVVQAAPVSGAGAEA